MLDREEYVEQAYLFRILGERMARNMSTQDLLESVGEEILATTKLPLAISFLSSELRHKGVFSTAMAQLSHYFTAFQTFVVAEAENDRGKFDLTLALEILKREALYRTGQPTPQGVFLYEFECLCRNRLGYDRGLTAIAADSLFDSGWKEWIDFVRRQVGLIDVADLIYVRSEHHADQQARRIPQADAKPLPSILFGEREGRIALANRRRDPLLLFEAFHRHLGYPAVPRPMPIDATSQVLPQMQRRLERIEARLKLVEEEQRGGIDLTRFYGEQGNRDPLEP